MAIRLAAMRVLVAPDKFRGTLTAAEAAHAIATGWRRARPQDEIEEVPLADGGEEPRRARRGVRASAPITVHGPLGDPVRAEFGLVRARTASLRSSR
jgi:glycerate kinase